MKTVMVFLSLLLCCTSAAYADLFGSGENTFNIEFVTIGNPGNAGDTTGKPNPAGSVDETFRMGQFEISEGMFDKANALGGPNITHNRRGENKPVTSVSWFEAAQFVNWLNTSSDNSPAYKFDSSGNFQLWAPSDAGYNRDNLYRNSEARYFLPSADEWYKAAYYDLTSGSYFDFPTGSDTPPTAIASGTAAGTIVYNQREIGSSPADITLAGALSPSGTMGQGGNVFEWNETDSDLVNDSTSDARGVRGGSWDFHRNLWAASDRFFGVSPSSDVINVGFRVASVPEPSSLLLGAMVTIGLLVRRFVA